MPSFIDPSFGPAGHLRAVLWSTYLAAAVILPIYHVRPILRYVRGSNGIGDACVRTEAIQCLWRLPALLYSVFVAPSLPLFLSIALDLVGRIGRVLAMHASRRRWQAMQACRLPGPDSDLTGRGRVHGGTRPASHDQGPVMQTTIRTRTTPMDAAAAFLVRVATATFSALRAARGALRAAFARRRTEEWLDDATLRDLGVDRSERSSYQAESRAIVETTRRRVAARSTARG